MQAIKKHIDGSIIKCLNIVIYTLFQYQVQVYNPRSTINGGKYRY